MAGQEVLVAGAGGFIGGHLVGSLLADGHSVRGVDKKPLGDWFQVHTRAHSVTADLSQIDAARAAVDGVRVVYNLAADMGGMGFIATNRAACMLSVLISTHLLVAARDERVDRLFYASSACVYNESSQARPDVRPLREEDAYPAAPEDGYGWEKLFSERMARHFSEDFALPTSVVRYHNVYGPHGSWRDGREKAPAALARKVAEAVLTGSGSIEIWGDGEQSRSFMFIDDCIRGTRAIVDNGVPGPINLGSSELVTINELVDILEDIAGISLERRYRLDAPTGVRGRNSDNSLLRRELGWEPAISLRAGMEVTYNWVLEQYRLHPAGASVASQALSPQQLPEPRR